jgi:ankyrin repeat protein
LEERKEAAHEALETALSTEDVEALRTSAEETLRSERNVEPLRALAARVCETASLELVRAIQDAADLLLAGLEAVRTASRDRLCAMAVQAASQEGVDVNIRMEAPESLLRAAAKQGLVATMKALVEAGADVNATNDAGWTALTGATRMGQVEALKVLFEAGVAVNHQVP